MWIQCLNMGYGDNGNGCYYQTIEQVREWYKNWNNGSGNFYAYILIEDTGVFVGEVDIHWSRHYNAHMIGVVIDSKYREKRYSVKAIDLLVKQAFDVMKLEKIIDEFPSARVAAERAFAKVGFERINEGLVELTKESYAKYRKLL